MPVEETQTAPKALSLSADSRILALDWGERRVGLALSDPLGISAQGLPTMERRNHRQDMNFLRSLIRKHHVALILLGNPLQMSGEQGSRAVRMGEVAEQLRTQLEIEVQLWDERLTSLEAHRVLDQAGVIHSERGGAVDRMAAVLLLQNFLDRRSVQPAPKDIAGGE